LANKDPKDPPCLANFQSNHHRQHQHYHPRLPAAIAPSTTPNNEPLKLSTGIPALQIRHTCPTNKHLAKNRTTNMSATAKVATSDLLINAVDAEEE
jgi:hypothetical protein